MISFSVPEEIEAATNNPRALFVVSHSGGKDSKGTGIVVSELVPPERQLWIHATLGESEWPGALEHARDHAAKVGAPFQVVRSQHTFLGLVEQRFQSRPDAPSWPSPQFRRCTSDLKHAPITKLIKAYAKEHGFTTVVSAMGLRAEESRNRARLQACMLNAAQSIADRPLKGGRTKTGRTWYDWLPIHEKRTHEVLDMAEAAEIAQHPAYALGNERMSCIFCIMGCRNDLTNGAVHNPEVYRKYVQMEEHTGYTFHPSLKRLPEITGIQP